MNSNFANKRFSSFLKSFKDSLGRILGPKNFSKRTVPRFNELEDAIINRETGINPKWTYRNQIYWTPKFYIQKDISQEFLFQLKKFRKLTQWEDAHQIALIELVLTEAIRDTSYEMEFNYRIRPSLYNPLHGLIDVLIYNNDENSNYYPCVPVILPHYSKEGGVYLEKYNQAQIVGIAYTLLKNYKINYPGSKDVEYIKALQTNGHDWCLWEVHDSYVKKTNFFRPKLIQPVEGYMPKLFDDYAHLQTVLGLIRYALNLEDNMVLKSSNYKLGEKSENVLIEHKEAVSSLKLDSPDLIDNIGLNEKLLENKNENSDNKLLK